ncbi:MAG: diaminopimelate epimerase [Bacteroidales bacterium]
MKMHFYKYQGTGNDFIIIDALKSDVALNPAQIKKLCDRRFGIGADGLMVIKSRLGYDFEMLYYNSDGYEGTMCGNGARCILRYASNKKLIDKNADFMVGGNVYHGRIDNDLIHVIMNDVEVPSQKNGHSEIDTGSPHIVIPVSFLENYDVIKEGRRIRYDTAYKPDGINVNFIEEISENEINMRTYERGVEAETWSCGTGAIAGAVFQATRHEISEGSIDINMPGGTLKVSFTRSGDHFVNIRLSGPAVFVFEGEVVV